MSFKILIIDDEIIVRKYLVALIAEINGFEPDSAHNVEKAKQLIKSINYDLIISDINLKDGSGMDVLQFCIKNKITAKVVMVTGFGSIENAVESIKMGAIDYIEKPIDISMVKKIISKVKSMKPELSNDNCPQEREVKDNLGIFKSKAIQNIIEHINNIADTDATVLISGESGTGKEVIAQRIHSLSNRNRKPFVAINCAAIPATLVESEMFGHEKGAFTGAESEKEGKFEAANQGTILLDEITEMPFDLQAKLLRVIQERKLERLGSNELKSINTRIIATTNRNITKTVEEGKFREDLFYRLNVINIELPPLRERKEDIIPLSNEFINKFSLKYHRKNLHLSKEDEKVLLNHRWNGNIRELINVIERSVILSKDGSLKILLSI